MGADLLAYFGHDGLDQERTVEEEVGEIRSSCVRLDRKGR